MSSSTFSSKVVVEPCPPRLCKLRSSTGYIAFTVSFGLMVDLTTYGLIVPVVPFHLAKTGYADNIIASTVTYLMAAQGVGLIISSIPISMLGERYKNRRLLLLCFPLVLAISLILFWKASPLPVLIFSRILQGASGTGIWTIGLALICDTVPESKKGTIIGYVLIGWSLGMIIGPLMGGILYDSLGYDAIFISALILTGVDFLFRLFMIEKKKADVLKELHSTDNSATIQLETIFGVSQEDQTETLRAVHLDLELKGETSSNLKAPKQTSLESSEESSEKSVSERNGREPKHPMVSAVILLARCGRFWTLLGIIFLIGSSAEGLLNAGLTLVVSSRYGLGPKEAALVLAAGIAPSFVASPLAGYSSDRYTTKWPTLLCLGLAAPAFAFLALHTRLYVFIMILASNEFFVTGASTIILEDFVY